jgi:hypothetical protein
MLTSHLEGALGLAAVKRIIRGDGVGVIIATALLLAIGSIAVDYARMLWLRSKMVQCTPKQFPRNVSKTHR